GRRTRRRPPSGPPASALTRPPPFPQTPEIRLDRAKFVLLPPRFPPSTGPAGSRGEPSGQNGSIERVRGPCTAPAHARPRWAASARGGRGAALPRRRLVGAGRLPGGRCLLRPQRVPDHEPAAGRMARRRADRVAGVLGPAGASAPPGAVPRPRCRRGLRRGDRGAGRARASAKRRPHGSRVRRQLGPDLLAPVVLRVVRCAVTPAAHVVTRDRGAVLPRVAAGR